MLKNCKLLIKLSIISILCLSVQACNSDDYAYVTREDLTNDAVYLVQKSEMKQPKNYGAIKVVSEDQNEDEGQLFLLQRKKGTYQTETMFHKTKDKRFYFSVGMNYKDKEPRVGLRMEF